MLDLALLGTGGTLPLPGRWLASTLMRVEGRLTLFDCGEGTQISLRSLGWGIKDIDLILISHVHGDHVLGAPGVLLALASAGRTLPVQVAGPPGLRRVLEHLCVVAQHLPFEVWCREIEDGQPFSSGRLIVKAARGDHHVPCLAYRVEIPRTPRFLADQARDLGVPREQWSKLQRGDPVELAGRTIRPEEVLGPARRGLAVGLVTDTRPAADLVELVRGVDVLVCEGTFARPEEQGRAEQRKHMTFGEAARFARDAGVGQLVLTHFGAALTEPHLFAAEAQTIFPATTIGRDHLTLSLAFPSESSAP